MWPDWVERAAWPVVLVVGMRLGCLNHALLTAQTIRQRAHLLGWVANCLPPQQPLLDENLAWLDRHMPAPRLATVGSGQAEISPELLEQALRQHANVALQQSE